METGETPRPTNLETAPKTRTTEKGLLGRGEEAPTRIVNLLERIKEKLTMGGDFARGSPDAPFYLGLGVKLGREKTIDPVIEAGMRTLESIKNGLVEGGIRARERLLTRLNQIKGKTEARVSDLSRRAAFWGLKNVGLHDKLRKIYEVPANIGEWPAKGEQVIKIKTKLAIEARARERRIKTLPEKIAGTLEDIKRLVGILDKLRGKARSIRTRLKNGSTTWREGKTRVWSRKPFKRARS